MGDFVGDRQCVTHHACECIMASAKAAEQLEVERDALRGASRELRDAACAVALVEWETVPHCAPYAECATQLGTFLCQRCRVRRLTASVRAVSEALAASVSKEEARGDD